MDETRNEVSDNLVTLSKQLRLQVMLSAIIHLDLLIKSHYLLLVCSLPSLKFSYILVVDISPGCEVSTLPVIESVVGNQTINSDD